MVFLCVFEGDLDPQPVLAFVVVVEANSVRVVGGVKKNALLVVESPLDAVVALRNQDLRLQLQREGLMEAEAGSEGDESS